MKKWLLLPAIIGILIFLVSCYEKALDEFLDVTKAKLDEINRM